MARNLKTVGDFAQSTPFTEAQLRWWIFHAADNGLAKTGAIVRIGRRVYLDTVHFETWLEKQNPGYASSDAQKAAPANPVTRVYELQDQGASTRQIAAKTGIPKSTVHRLMRSAPSSAFVEHLEGVQTHVLNAIAEVRSGECKSAEVILRSASVALSQAIAACAERDQ